MTTLPYLAVHRVSGTDAGAFLHAQLAADTASLSDGKACFAAWCSPRGQVIALLLVCRQDSSWFLVADAGLATAVANRLRMYVLRANVSIAAQPEIQVAGLRADEDPAAGTMVFAPGHVPLRYALIPRGPEDKYASLCWRREEIMHGITWLQDGTSERFLPQMLGVDAIGAVSFSKGCYPGQEIIARARYLGKLKRRPVLLELDGNPPLHPGETCVLVSGGGNIEAAVADAVCADGKSTTLRLVAPLEAEYPVNAVIFAGRNWPARRIET